MKYSNLACLWGFCVKCVVLPAAYISKDIMRTWAILNGVSKARSLLKQKLCKSIVDCKLYHDIAVVYGTVKTFDPIMQLPL
jgi:hypothetical protein